MALYHFVAVAVVAATVDDHIGELAGGWRLQSWVSCFCYYS